MYTCLCVKGKTYETGNTLKKVQLFPSLSLQRKELPQISKNKILRNMGYLSKVLEVMEQWQWIITFNKDFIEKNVSEFT